MSSINKTKSTSRREHSAQAPGLMHDVGKGLLISIGIAVSLNLLASLAAYFAPDPAALARPLGLAASAVTALLGGYVTARIHRHAALFCGLANGCGMITLLLLSSFCVGSLASGYSFPVTLLLHLAYVALSLVGALLGIRQKPKSKTKRRTAYASRSL